MPVMSVAQAVERKGMINQFIGSVLKEGEDYGKIPGAGDKKVLLKPGAEKLCSIFGLSVTYSEDKIVEDWTGEDHGGEPLFYYSYRAQLSRGDRFMGEAIGSCNTWETKYRYRWVPEEVAKQRPDFDKLPKRGGRTSKFEPDFAIDKKETGGQYGKPAEYWAMFDAAIRDGSAKQIEKMMGKKKFWGWEVTMDQTQYRIPSPDVSDSINTCQKMAQKRGLVSAVLVVTNCSDSFTPDMEDFADHEPSTPFDTPEQAKRAERNESKQAQTVETGSFNGKRPLPTTMLASFERIQKNRGAFVSVCEAIQTRMIEAHGRPGDDAYMAVCEGFSRKYPSGTTDINAFREVLIDLYEAGENLEGVTK